jgi:hypothetical protein
MEMFFFSIIDNDCVDAIVQNREGAETDCQALYKPLNFIDSLDGQEGHLKKCLSSSAEIIRRLQSSHVARPNLLDDVKEEDHDQVLSLDGPKEDEECLKELFLAGGVKRVVGPREDDKDLWSIGHEQVDDEEGEEGLAGRLINEPLCEIVIEVKGNQSILQEEVQDNKEDCWNPTS